MKYESVSRILKQIDDAVNKSLPPPRTGLRSGETKRECLERFLPQISTPSEGKTHQSIQSADDSFDEASVEEEPPDAEFIEIDHPDYDRGLICKESLILAWKYCGLSKSFFVPGRGRQFRRVSTPGFEVPPEKFGFRNEFFDITTGKTLRSNISLANSCGGAVNEDVFIEPNRLNALLSAIERGDPETFFTSCDEQNKAGRPRKRDDVRATYDQLFPEGHDNLTWKEVAQEIEKTIEKRFSVDTLKRALGRKK